MPTPVNVTIPDGCVRWATSRSNLYRVAGEGKIIFRKSGRRTLVDVESGDKYFLSLPVAKIKGPVCTLRPATNPVSPATPVTTAAPAPNRRRRVATRKPKSAPPSAPVTSPPIERTEQSQPSESR
jgi:hypothetical protein